MPTTLGEFILTFNSEYEPFFQPPGWVIGPIWLVLYTTIAISLLLALSKKEELNNANLIFVSFFVQLMLNLLWPSVFNSEKYLLALFMLVLMILFKVVYAYLIFESVPAASKLVWPYIAWISFAAIINTSYYLNSIDFF